MKSIRNRNIKIQLWLNKAEARNLQEKARRSHLSVAAYLRQLISGVVPKEAPPPDFFSMMRELHYIGNNLNQIAMKAHALNAIDAKHYDEGVRMFDSLKSQTNVVLENCITEISNDGVTPGRGFTNTPNSVSRIQTAGVISSGKSCEAHPNAERRGKIRRGTGCV